MRLDRGSVIRITTALLLALGSTVSAQAQTATRSTRTESPVATPTNSLRATAGHQHKATHASGASTDSQETRPTQAAYNRPIPTQRNYVPRHQRVTGERVIDVQIVESPQPEAIQGPIIYEDGGEFLMDEGPVAAAPAGDPCCSGQGCFHCCLLPCPLIGWDRLELFYGTHGVTGPANRGSTGSFGFHEGGNLGAPLPCFGGQLGMQAGARVAHSNFSGAEFSDDDRTQVFVTGGIFRRVDWGLQGGVVVDYLNESWYYDIEPVQLRSEISWIYPEHHELGFWFTQNLSESEATSIITTNSTRQTLTEDFEPVELYAFFYRYRVNNCGGGEGRFFAGFTNDSDGLIGSEMNLPLTRSVSLDTAITYLVPEQTRGNAHIEEAWNVSISMVWYPGGRNTTTPDYFRPLLKVAGNNNFILDRTTR